MTKSAGKTVVSGDIIGLSANIEIVSADKVDVPGGKMSDLDWLAAFSNISGGNLV
jgi:hypothetical protein